MEVPKYEALWVGWAGCGVAGGWVWWCCFLWNCVGYGDWVVWGVVWELEDVLVGWSPPSRRSLWCCGVCGCWKNRVEIVMGL